MATEERVTEKIYCYDHPSAYKSNDGALMALAAMCNNRRGGDDDDFAKIAMLSGGGLGNQQWNNPFTYLVWMMMAERMGFGGPNGNGWGGNGNMGRGFDRIETQNQFDSLRNQIAENQNSSLFMDAIKGNESALRELQTTLNCDFNTLQGAICDVRGGIDKLAGQIGFSSERVINSVVNGNSGIIAALKDCCCSTQKELLKMQGDIQLQNCQQTNAITNAINTVAVGQERGFSSLAFEAEKNKCDIIAANNANAQRIVDVLQGHWKDELALQVQDLKFENSQIKQTERLMRLLGGKDCGCGSGCGL